MYARLIIVTVPTSPDTENKIRDILQDDALIAEIESTLEQRLEEAMGEPKSQVLVLLEI